MPTQENHTSKDEFHSVRWLDSDGRSFNTIDSVEMTSGLYLVQWPDGTVERKKVGVASTSDTEDIRRAFMTIKHHGTDIPLWIDSIEVRLKGPVDG